MDANHPVSRIDRESPPAAFGTPLAVVLALLCACAAGLLAPLSLGAAPEAAGTATPPTRTPPQVVSMMNPQPGATGVPVTGRLYVTFARAVDHRSAEAALSLQPAVAGTVTWSGGEDARVLVFVPDDEWPENTTITVRVSAGVAGPDGKPTDLARFEATFTTGESGRSVGFEYGPNVRTRDAAPGGERTIRFMAEDAGRVRVRLYTVPPARFAQLFDQYGGEFGWWGDGDMPDIPVAGLPMVRDFTVTREKTDRYWSLSTFEIPGDVMPGLYVVKLSVFNAESAELFLVYSRNTLLVKPADGQITAWVTSIQGSRPAAATVTVYAADGSVLAAGPTDGQGMFRAGLPRDAKPAMVVADTGGDLAASGFDEAWRYYVQHACGGRDPVVPDAPRWMVNIYTERPIYRPGQTVYVKAILRRDWDAQMSVPAGQPVTVRLRDSRNYVLGESKLTASAFGSVDTRFEIAEGAPLGEYHVELSVENEVFKQVLKVEEYVKPEIEVLVSTDATHYVAGEPVTVTVEARYLFGQPAAGLPVSLIGLGYDRWSWDWETGVAQRRWIDLNIGTYAGKTDADGKWVVSVKAPFRSAYDDYYYYYGWYNVDAETVAFEATLEGEAGPLSGHAAVTVHRALYNLKPELARHGTAPGEDFPARFVVRDMFGRPVGGAVVTMTVTGWDWDARDDIRITELATTSDAHGVAAATIKIDREDWYELTAETVAPNGETVTVTTWMWVWDWRGSGWDYYSAEGRAIQISADRDQYAPGDTAQLLVQSSLKGRALLTLERATVHDVFVVELTGKPVIVEVPIKPGYAPNIYAKITMYEPFSIENADSWEQLRVADLRTASVMLSIPATDRVLQVEASPDRAQAMPGESVDVTVQATGADGLPAQAEVSVAVVDEAIYLLSPDLSASLYDTFYGDRPNSINTYWSLQARGNPGAECGGGGDGESAAGARLRADFPDIALWSPAVMTGADGRAVVRVQLPDSLTRWRIVVRAVTAEDQVRVGQETAAITVTQPIMLRPQLPTALVEGDALTLTAVVANYATRPATITVWSELEGLRQNGAEITRTIALTVGESSRVEWPVTAETRGMAVVRMHARSDAGGDSIELKVPVVPRAVLSMDVQSGMVTSTVALTTSVPAGKLDASTTLDISLSSTLAGSLLEGIEFLTGYPYGCVEQTMSAAFPNAAVSRAFRLAGVDASVLSPDLPSKVDASVQRLYGYQHADGGWGWWYDDPSDAYQTAWVIYGLSAIRDAGFLIDDTALQRGAEWLKERLEGMDPNTRAYALYAMAMAGHGDLAATQALAANVEKDRVNLFGQAGLAIALDRLGDRKGANAALDLVASLAVQTGPYAYWDTGDRDGHYHEKTMASTKRTTALVLSALVRLRPDDPLVMKTVQWLMAGRTPSGWGSTQETSYAIIALSDYLVKSGELGGVSDYTVEVNGQVVGSGRVPDPNNTSVPIEISLRASMLREGENQVRITRTGTGRLYYVVSLKMYREDLVHLAEGPIKIERSYLDKDGNPVRGPVHRGDVLTVRLTVRMPGEGSYVLIEDMLPAGFAALNENLGTSSYDGTVAEEHDRGWGTRGYNRKDVRDDRVDFFITTLKSGTTTFTYRIRALHDGTFYALPAQVSLMYSTLLWGHSAGSVLVVNSAQPAPAMPGNPPGPEPLATPNAPVHGPVEP